MTIAIIDYGMGNVGSLRNMLKKAGAQPVIASTPEALAGADKIILPGVGAFDQCMEKLIATGFRAALDRLVLEEAVPILGICVGMQLFTEKSAEGKLPGLGWIAGRTVRFDRDRLDSSQRIPHMGWNEIEVKKPNALFSSEGEKQRFYFLHSYHVMCDAPDDVLTETVHGYPFASALSRKNITAVQFHPEKSHRFGMEFFRRFAEAA